MRAGRAPVVAGVGQVVQRPEPGAPGPLDAVGLMAAAARLAADDAGSAALLGRVDAVLVPEGTWSPGNAGGAVAAALGCTGARTTLARVGVLQTTLLARAADDIVAGRADVVLIVGGEAKASARAGLTAVVPASPVDVELAPSGDILTALEIERGLAVPVQSYAVQEDALRRAAGRSAGAHGRHLDQLWDGFAAVAATNPYAWDPDATGGDRVISTPYARRHCSQWNVDMAAAVIVCAAGLVEGDRGVHLHAVVGADAMVPVSRRAELHRSPAVASVGERLADLTGIAPADVDHVDLYSCFPSAVQIQAAELGIDLGRRLTVTGGMSYGGGPLNSAALHAVASMVDVLRADPDSTGIVTAVSGMLTKHGAALLSTAPPAHGYRSAVLVDEVLAATATVEVDPDYEGEVVIEGATVVHDRQGPAFTVVLGRTPDGARVVSSTDDLSVDGPAAVVRGRR